jgi:predicted amino acid-binding ACT domain protein
VPTLAVTVIGADRPGIIAAVAAALADVDGTIEHTSMSTLRGRLRCDAQGRRADRGAGSA